MVSQYAEGTWLYKVNTFLGRFSVFLTVLNILRCVGTVHIRLQQVVLHTLQPLLVSFTLILIQLIVKNVEIASLIAGVIVFEMVLYEMRLFFERSRAKIKADLKAREERHQAAEGPTDSSKPSLKNTAVTFIEN